VFWDRRTVPRGVDHSVQGFNPDVCINPGRMVETWKTPFDGANRTQAGSLCYIVPPGRHFGCTEIVRGWLWESARPSGRSM
jgi:hypothetical protein